MEEARQYSALTGARIIFLVLLLGGLAAFICGLVGLFLLGEIALWVGILAYTWSKVGICILLLIDPTVVHPHRVRPFMQGLTLLAWLGVSLFLTFIFMGISR